MRLIQKVFYAKNSLIPLKKGTIEESYRFNKDFEIG